MSLYCPGEGRAVSVDAPTPAHARTGPFAWSPMSPEGAGYLVASSDGESPIIDVVLVDDAGTPAWSLVLSPADAYRLADQLSDLAADQLTAVSVGIGASDQSGLAASAVGRRTSGRKLTTMGGLFLALGLVSTFWAALALILWLTLR